MLTWALSACGRGAEAFAPLERHRQNPWARAAIAFGRGEPAAAAGVFAEMGAHASEACCRLSAARELIGQRRDADADVHLQSALGFYRQVGAAR